MFGEAGQPAALHYGASFVSRGAEHRMEVWRDGETRLKRQTDDVLSTFVSRDPGSDEYEMTILDRPRKIVTRINRSNLYRVGNFTDWYDLAHGLKHPLGAYRLALAQAPDGAPAPAAECAWYDLTQAGHTVHVCWDDHSRLPMLLLAEGGAVLWRVTAWDTQAAPPGTFEIRDAGYIRNDANDDMDRD